MLAAEFQLPLPLKLVIAIMVRHSIILSAQNLREIVNNSDINPAYIKILNELSQQNKSLLSPESVGNEIALLYNQSITCSHTVSAFPCYNSTFVRFIKTYCNFLLSLGFTWQEVDEMFPSNMPIPKMLSLKEQAGLCYINAQLTSSRDKVEDVLDYLKKLGIEINPIFIARQQYINTEKKYYNAFFLDKDNDLYLTRHSFRFTINTKIIMFLLNHLNTRTDKLLQIFDSETGFNIAHIAAAYSPCFMFKEIAKLPGFDLTVQTRVGKLTYLHLAIYSQDTLTFNNILSQCINNPTKSTINTVNILGQSPLYFAVSIRILHFVKKLVDCGAKLDLIDQEENGLLHRAAESYGDTPSTSYHKADHLALGKYLIAKGAPFEIYNNARKNPFELFLGYSKCPVDTITFFEKVYKKRWHQRGFFYQNFFDSPKLYTLVHRALNQSVGLTFLFELVHFNPSIIGNYRDLNENNVTHYLAAILNNENRGIRRFEKRIYVFLLDTICKRFPKLIFKKNLQGKRSFDTLADFFIDEMGELTFYRTTFIYQHLTHAKRVGIGNILLVMCGIAIMWCLLINSIPLTIRFSLASLGTLLLIWLGTSPRFWDQLEFTLHQKIDKISQWPNASLEFLCGQSLTDEDEYAPLEEIVTTDTSNTLIPSPSPASGRRE